MSDRLGQQLGSYRLIQLLGQGGFAEVYLGQHVYLESYAAIKVLYTHLAQEDISSFLTEARTLVRLIHPHIVRLLDFGVQGTVPFLVMDYAPNGTLRQLHPKGMRVPLHIVVDYVQQLGDALQYAHNEKLIHRDIKPENMLLGRHNEILLSDFGIAIVAQTSRQQHTQDSVGTVAYMAPEQIQAHPRPASDQYALGIVVYEWLTGERPFQGSFSEIAAKQCMTPPPPLRAKLPALPLEVEQVVMTALAKDPKDRFASIQAFANALEQASRPSQSSATDLPIIGPSRPLEEKGVAQAAPPPFIDNRPSSDRLPPVPFAVTVPEPSDRLSANIPMTGPFSAQEVHSSSMHLQEKTIFAEVNSSLSLPGGTKTAPGKRPRYVTLVALIILIIAIVVSGSVIYANSQAIDHAHATATAQSLSDNLTATAVSQHQGATAIVAQVPTAYDVKGVLALDDPLRDNTKGNKWEEDSGTSGSCKFIQGALDISTHLLEWCPSRGADFHDFVYQVQMTIVKGDGGGIAFRLDTPDEHQFYYFYIGQDSSYSVQMVKGDAVSDDVHILHSTSTAIHKGLNQANLIAVVARGNTFTVYVNLTRVTSFTDSTHTHGKIAVLADGSNNLTEVVFHDAKVWTLS